MQITSIECTASRTFNHPTERFANFRFSVKLTADLSASDQDNALAKVRELKQQAENIAEAHKQEILQEIRVHGLRSSLRSRIQSAKNAPDRIAAYQAKLAAVNDNETPEWQVREWRRVIEEAQQQQESLPALLQQFASLPAPLLLPEPEIHPGHPDHPDTDSQDFDSDGDPV